MGNWLPLSLVLGVVLVTSYISMGLLALWAATSRWYWLLRSAVVLAVLSLLLFISAYELWSLLALQACTVVGGNTIWRWCAARRQEGGKAVNAVLAKQRFAIQFSIRALLALTCLIAMLTPTLVLVVRNTEASAELWVATVLGGICGGYAVLIGAWLGTTRRKWPFWLAASLSCVGLASLAAWFDFWLTLVFSESLAALVWVVVIPVVAATTWLLLRLWFAGGTTPAGTVGRTRRFAARSMFWLLLAALALPPAYVAWELAHPLPVPDLPVPRPNGIDDIVAAGKALDTSPILSAGAEPQSTEELAAEVAKYADDYARLRLGLTRDILATIWAVDGKIDTAAVFSTGPTAANSDAVRHAAQGLMRESQLAQQQKRYGDAARIALDNMHLGQVVTRNGLLIDYLTGVMIERMGDQSLYEVLPQLNADECRDMIAALAGMERRREPIEDVLRRERICSENLFGWFGHFHDLAIRLASTDHRRRMFGVRDRQQATTRLLIAELALHAYQLEHGALPDQLDQLTPEFLTELPVDPFDRRGRPLRYVRTEDGYVLYSIGRDGEDDGGRPTAPHTEIDGDPRLDVFFSRDDDLETGPPNE